MNRWVVDIHGDIEGDYEIIKRYKEPEIGRWIAVTNGRGGHECLLCHGYAPSYKNGDEWLAEYCPHCGARMAESEE